jgi:hypothetical protein
LSLALPVAETSLWISLTMAGSFLSGPSPHSTAGFSTPNALMVAEPTSERSGNVIPRCRLNAARMSAES